MSTLAPCRSIPIAILGAVALAGSLALLWPLSNNLYPLPAAPFILFPYAVLIWLVAGAVVVNLKPDLSSAAECPDLALDDRAARPA